MNCISYQLGVFRTAPNMTKALKNLFQPILIPRASALINVLESHLSWPFLAPAAAGAATVVAPHEHELKKYFLLL